MVRTVGERCCMDDVMVSQRQGGSAFRQSCLSAIGHLRKRPGWHDGAENSHKAVWHHANDCDGIIASTLCVPFLLVPTVSVQFLQHMTGMKVERLFRGSPCRVGNEDREGVAWKNRDMDKN